MKEFWRCVDGGVGEGGVEERVEMEEALGI